MNYKERRSRARVVYPTQDTSRHGKSKGETKGKNRHKNHSKIVV